MCDMQRPLSKDQSCGVDKFGDAALTYMVLERGGDKLITLIAYRTTGWTQVLEWEKRYGGCS